MLSPQKQQAHVKRSESKGVKRKRTGRILDLLASNPPAKGLELQFRNAFELLVATILSAQCTDERVNQVTPLLFKRFPTPKDLAMARKSDVEQLIHSTGFYKAKANNLILCSRHILERFRGTVPQSMDDLVSLPGVGRKTANVVRGNAFHLPAIVVDTHVKRVTHRLKMVSRTDPDNIEYELQQLIPASKWTEGSQHILLHGRYVCTARRPACQTCCIVLECSWEGKVSR